MLHYHVHYSSFVISGVVFLTTKMGISLKRKNMPQGEISSCKNRHLLKLEAQENDDAAFPSPSMIKPLQTVVSLSLLTTLLLVNVHALFKITATMYGEKAVPI